MHLRSSAVAFLLCAAADGTAAQAPTWQCSATGSGSVSPALTEAATDYLQRVEAIYPRQALGLVRAGDRYYLLNSGDVEWTERTRLHLLALRLRETYLTPERQGTGAAPGSSPPAGGFTCLAAARAEREGLTRAPSGEVVLAAGQSLHLINPQEPEVTVEVRAAPDRALNMGDMLRRSARAGIYAGLTGQAAPPPTGSATLSMPEGTITIRTASIGASAAAPPVSAPEPPPAAALAPAPAAPVEVAVAVASAVVAPEPPPVAAIEAPPPAAPVEVAVAAASPVIAPEPLPVAPPESPVAPARAVPAAVVPAPAAEPIAARPEPVPASVPQPAPRPAETIARAAPVVLPAAIAEPAPAGAVPAAYDDYAKAMKTLMALKRSRSVMSVSEMTYVHPAVEVFKTAGSPARRP